MKMITRQYVAIVLILFYSPISGQSTLLDISGSKTCHYTDTIASTDISFLGNDPRVVAMVNTICESAGISQDFKLEGGNVPSVSAVIDETGKYLFYSLFKARTLLDSDPKQLYLLLAHAIGHLNSDHQLEDAFRLKEESEADDFMGRALFGVNDFVSLDEVLMLLDQDQYIYTYLYPASLPEMRKNIIINGWKSEEGLVKAKDNLGYLDDLNVQKGLPLSPFVIKGCPKFHAIPLDLVSECKKVGDIDSILVADLSKLGYEKRSYYSAPNGFALLTAVEQIDQNGKPLQGKNRWVDYPSTNSMDSFFAYLSSLIFPQKGFFRLFVFLVSDEFLGRESGKLDARIAEEWLESGEYWLPNSVKNIPLNPSKHRFFLLIYEFEANTTDKKIKPICRQWLPIKKHLDNSGFENPLNNK